MDNLVRGERESLLYVCTRDADGEDRERSETNNTFSPSGLKRGCASKAMPAVSWRASPPERGRRYRSPSRSNTMVCPSGLTSREIQVPSSVSIWTVRPGSSGRLLSFFSFSVESARAVSNCCHARWAAGAARAPGVADRISTANASRRTTARSMALSDHAPNRPPLGSTLSRAAWLGNAS